MWNPYEIVKKLFTFHFLYLKIKMLLRILISLSPLDKSGFKRVILKCDYERYWFKKSCLFHKILTISTLNGKSCEQNDCVLRVDNFFWTSIRNDIETRENLHYNWEIWKSFRLFFNKVLLFFGLLAFTLLFKITGQILTGKWNSI